MAHSKVLQAVVAAGTDVLPMQFGVVMPSADAVCDELIAAHAEILLAQLDEHAGRVELDVTVTSPQDVVLRDVLERDARLAEAGRRLRAAGDAAGYHQRIEFGEAVAAAIEAERARTAAELMARLGPLAVDAAVDEPRHEDMLASVAFLVERRRLDEFDAKLDALGGERRVRCVGPLPAYHFVELVLDQEAGAWA